MSEDPLKKKTLTGIIWSAVERFSVQGIQFLVMLVIARILSPKEYGLIGMLAIFLAIAQSLTDSGFSQALIRKQDRTEADNSTVFYFNIAVSIALYGLLYLAAPFIASFYHEPLLTDVTRVIGLLIIVNAFSVVQKAIYTINLNFRTQAKASLAGAVISGAAGITMALHGYGVWTLVWQQLIGTLITIVLLWIYSSWRPQWTYSWASFRNLFAFGSKLMLSGLLSTIYANLYQLVIGKYFTASSLGYYTRAQQFAQFPSSNLTQILQRVFYPTLSRMQNDRQRLISVTRQFLCLSCLVVFPLMCMLAGMSKPLILLLLGEKWSYASTLLIPICLTVMWFPVHAINLNVLAVMGRSDLFLKLEVIKTVIGVVILAVSIQFGLLVLCYASILGSLLALYINTWYTKKEIGYGLLSQLRDLAPSILLSLSILLLCLAINSVISNSIIQLIADLILSSLWLAMAVWLFKFKEINYLKTFRHS